MTETDSKAIATEDDFQIEGYKTILPVCKYKGETIRIICLVKSVISSKFKVRLDLMNEAFPSIWLETYDLGSKKKQLFGGFCRVWTHNGINSKQDQMEKIELFAEQIDKASYDKNTRLLIIGDANLDANKWE